LRGLEKVWKSSEPWKWQHCHLLLHHHHYYHPQQIPQIPLSLRLEE
jgi:hypothetical protein